MRNKARRIQSDFLIYSTVERCIDQRLVSGMLAFADTRRLVTLSKAKKLTAAFHSGQKETSKRKTSISVSER